MPPIVSVLVPYAVAAPYSYRVPPGMVAAPGDVVEVPLGTRDVVGVVWDDPSDQAIAGTRLRDIAAKLDTPPLSGDIRRFVDWVAGYTLTSRGMVLRMVLRAPGALAPGGPDRRLPRARKPTRADDAGPPARAGVLDDGLARSKSGLAAAAGVGLGVVQGLVDAGALEVVSMPAEPVGAAARPRLRRTRP